MTTTLVNDDVVAGQFMYAGNQVTFTGKRAVVGGLDTDDLFTVNDGSKPSQDFTVLSKRRVSVAYYEIKAQKVV